MGAWGEGAFENDDALDWLFELADSSGLDVVTGALTGPVDDYLEAPGGTVMLAAAEVVAAALGRGLPSVPAEVTAWVEKHRGSVGQAECQLALAAVDSVISESSELRELWEESDGATWLEQVEDLRRRLQGWLARNRDSSA